MNKLKTINIDGIEYNLTPVKRLQVEVGDIITVIDHVGNSNKLQVEEIEWDNLCGDYVKTTYTLISYEKI
jgi:hypothetical protein